MTKLELTLAIIKPHITAVPFRLNDIHYRILSNGFYIIRTKKETISLNEASQFYHDHKGKFFFNRLVTFMSSGPCYIHILARQNAIEFWRTMMGPTKVFRTIFTHPESIRGVHGLSDTRNATHGSDSQQSFETEANFFFPNFNVAAWYAKEEQQFSKGEINFLQDELIHTIKSDTRLSKINEC